MKIGVLHNSCVTYKAAAIILAGLFMIIQTVTASYAHDTVWPEEKLKTLYPQAVSFEQKNLYVSDAQRASIEKRLGSKLREEDMKPSVYLAIVKSTPDSTPRKVAALLFIDAIGQGGKIEIGVVVNGKGDLIKVRVFENSEPVVISQGSFLGQFEGKNANAPFKVGADIKAPQGAVQSAQAIASGAKRGMLIIDEVFKKK